MRYSGTFATTFSGLVGGDVESDVIVSFGYGNAENAVNAGTHTITLTAKNKGPKYDNYAITYESANLDIAKRDITFVVDPIVKEYDGLVANFIVRAENIASTDSISQIVSLFKYGEAQTKKDVGTFEIELGAVSTASKAANYNISYSEGSTLTITKKSLVITADDKEKTYDGNLFTSFTVTACIQVVIKVTAQVDLLLPSFGYPVIPPCQACETNNNICPGIENLPLYPTATTTARI